MCFGSSFCQDTVRVHSRKSVTFDELKRNPKVKKAIKILSFLNYCDIRIDRPIEDAKTFECYKGKRIRRLEVEVVYPYGVSLDSPYYYHPTKLQAGANKIQFSTRDQVIKNEVLFKEGDAVDPQLFADTERNLWEKNIYKDIRFVIEEIGDDMVDVTIFVRDRWNIGFITSAGYNYVQVGLQFNNLFGLSQIVQADATFYFRTFAAYHVHWGYTYTNIRRSFVNIGFDGSYDILNQTGSVNVNRNFFSSKAQWAGRATFNIRRNNLVLPGEQFNYYNAWVSTVSEDFWLAKAFKLNGKLGEQFPLTRVVVSSRMQRTDYMSRPYTLGPRHIINFVDQNNILGAVGIAQWDYYVDHDVYSLDKSEYFTKGVSAALIGGFQNDEILQRRTYLAAALQYGISFVNAGYLLSFVKAGAFVNPHTLDQGLIDWENTFYTIPVKMHKWSWRSFITTNMKLGFSRPLGSELVINNSNGLRGLNSLYLRGIRTYGLSYESDFYYSKPILGFSSSYFVFADLSLLQPLPGYSEFQSGVGVGFRLRNLGIGLGFLEVTFAYYPNLQVPDQRQFSLMGNVISNRTPVKKDLFGPDILNVD
ncbi:MAG: hypothetical protein JWO03_290 [Bacteroidetes bacterium]|nr:hypothetical protein [Bacteroidota bacterium]